MHHQVGGTLDEVLAEAVVFIPRAVAVTPVPAATNPRVGLHTGVINCASYGGVLRWLYLELLSGAMEWGSGFVSPLP